MARQSKNFFSKLRKLSRTNKIIAAVFAVSVAIVGYTIYSTLAASTPTIYVQPSSANVGSGQVISIAIRVDTAGQATNAVQADLTYSQNFLEFQNIDSSGSAYSIEAQASGGNGSVSIARGNINDVTGDALVATVHFKVIATSGSGSVTFSDSTVLLRSSDSSNILGDKINGSYQVPGSGAGTAPSPPGAPPAAPGTTSKPTPSTSTTPNPASTPNTANTPVTDSAPAPAAGQEQVTDTTGQAAKKSDNTQLFVVAGIVSAVIVGGFGLVLYLRSRSAADAPSGGHFNEPRTDAPAQQSPTFKPGEWHDPNKQY